MLSVINKETSPQANTNNNSEKKTGLWNEDEAVSRRENNNEKEEEKKYKLFSHKAQSGPCLVVL